MGKKTKNTPIDKNTHQLKPGRRPCRCQARLHGLVRNCLNCGRIVCTQEGSGPCFHCGNLVYSREEEKIINAGDKKSYELLKRLSDLSNAEVNFDSVASNLSGESIDRAQLYKQKLLKADKNCDATTVKDLESDYFTVENNAFLSPEDRELIIERKEELRRKAREERRKIIFSLDISAKTITEEKQLEIEIINDPIIQGIFANATRVKEETGGFAKNSIADFLDTFRPTYIGEKNVTRSTTPKVAVKRSLDPHWCVALPPPLAYQLANGLRSHIPWYEEFPTRQFIFIAALEPGQRPMALNESWLTFGPFAVVADVPPTSNNDQHVSGAIVGRAFVADCLTFEEYKMEYPDAECTEVESGFVVTFDLPQAFLTPFPYTSPGELYPLEKSIFDEVRRQLQRGDTISNDLIALCDV